MSEMAEANGLGGTKQIKLTLDELGMPNYAEWMESLLHQCSARPGNVQLYYKSLLDVDQDKQMSWHKARILEAGDDSFDVDIHRKA